MKQSMAVMLCCVLLAPPVFSYGETVNKAETIKKMEKALPAETAPAAGRVTRMRAAGVVTEITDSTLKIERKVKDQVETMEFTLEKPVPKIKPGDKVRVSYITKDDKNIAARVNEDIPQKAIKKVKKAEGKIFPGVVAPFRK